MEQKSAHRLATVRLVPSDEPSEGVVVDVLFASSGIEQEITDRAEPLAILDGVVAPVAVLSDLLALKVLAEDPRRPQDHADIRNLLAVAEPSDLALARSALELIDARGFHRDKRLIEVFERLTG